MTKIDLTMRKIPNSPYKIVLSNWQVVGIFNRNRFISAFNLTPEMKKVVNLFHAATLKERVLS